MDYTLYGLPSLLFGLFLYKKRIGSRPAGLIFFSELARLSHVIPWMLRPPRLTTAMSVRSRREGRQILMHDLRLRIFATSVSCCALTKNAALEAFPLLGGCLPYTVIYIHEFYYDRPSTF
ncbi:unnamed protein product [Chondrus crispus]|uniref:Uncharacterized protein n=1 Tax=Chondrus crispus TaxID=2769 RepID=R7QCS0_CHOCR|nr:unnamed protein product [Chondrus crispus]CDF35869.1 unnamed protein product [Chondrus crispus]|eukprot:XP_005715688.1 unnamed protein product [Chondrus crispus]